MLKAWASLDATEWAGPRINGSDNALFLRADLHGSFGDFRWWLEPTVSFRVVNTRSKSKTFITGYAPAIYGQKCATLYIHR